MGYMNIYMEQNNVITLTRFKNILLFSQFKFIFLCIDDLRHLAMGVVGVWVMSVTDRVLDNN